MTHPTALTAEDHQRAYAHFNGRLFGGELPTCLITLGDGRFKGYFRANAFRHLQKGTHIDEIALNPTLYETLDDYLRPWCTSRSICGRSTSAAPAARPSTTASGPTRCWPSA